MKYADGTIYQGEYCYDLKHGSGNLKYSVKKG